MFVEKYVVESSTSKRSHIQGVRFLQTFNPYGILKNVIVRKYLPINGIKKNWLNFEPVFLCLLVLVSFKSIFNFNSVRIRI